MLPFSDWRIEPEEIEIDCRPDGTLWRLGGGGFGDVRAPPRGPMRRRARPRARRARPRPTVISRRRQRERERAAAMERQTRHPASYLTLP
jgi:hypothetical protein